MDENLNNRIEAKRQEILTIYELRAVQDIKTASESVQALLGAVDELIALSQGKEIENADR